MKKQIAVLMAAATAVTTVAPAIANADVTNHKDVSVNEAVEKARKALNDKYDNEKANGITIPTGSSLAKDYLNSKYIVLVNKPGQGFKEYSASAYKDFQEFNADVTDTVKIVNGAIEGDGWYVVDNATKLGTLLESYSNSEEKPVVAIIDKGSKDGSSTKKTDQKHYVKSIENDGKWIFENNQEVSLTKTAKYLVAYVNEANRVAEGKEKDETFVESLKIWSNDYKNGEYVINNKEAVAGKTIAEITKMEVELTGGKKITLELGDDALDFTETKDGVVLFAVNKDGDIEINNNYGEEFMKSIEEFDTIENEGDNKSVVIDIKNGDTEVYTVDSNAVEESLGLENIYTREDGYTSEGKDFVNGIINAKKEPWRFNFRGSNYELLNKNESNIKLGDAKIDKSGDGYKLTFNVDVKDANDEDVTKTLKFVVKGDSQRDLYDVLRDLKGNVEVVSGHFTKLAGSNRYATAIAVSEEQFKPDTAKSVVIVGGKAQLDGLAAAPLASAKNAPILLADPNTGLNRDTIKEIDRACESLKNKTVYIVGGEQSVPAKVVKQLEDEFGAVVQRLAGSNRKTTSLEVAKRLKYDGLKNKRAFIVGSEGAADAMSVSSIASMKNNIGMYQPGENDTEVSPILVVDKNGIDRETREFIKTKLETNNAYLIGGEQSLSTQVLRDLGTAEVATRKRISGDNRYDTNVEVIKEFYVNSKSTDTSKVSVNGAIFASGENDYLVDAQTAGSFAAAQRSPIVLSGNKLTKDQVDLMKDGGVLDNQRANIYQVGGVVSSDVMKVVVDKLDL
ncbi:hypothetical protein UF10_08955 [Peptostreptococcus russellii]|uniref:Cell wall binding repeat 2 n=1 Tax=Peptostreptococcus russellii TaxID=215200 RepID=A0A2P7PZ34_9FIRM|nr:cell wall-binding repeat-containing protein [Peptostreptococcus russellii]PSJ30969.1 hypothetical protein UF10_08955 [Peptostreptococcus russellii]